MTPETITVSKVKDLAEMLRMALSVTESVLKQINDGTISPQRSSFLINQKLDEIFAQTKTADEIVEFLSRCVPAKTMEQVFIGIWKLAENIQE